MASKSEQDILKEAKTRFKRVSEYEASARSNYDFDTKFANGDSSNMFQWPEDQRSSNLQTQLTVNKTMEHCLQVINDQRQQSSQVQVRPTGDGATYESAQIYEGIIRHIENASNAQAAYENAYDTMVIGGIGWWRIVTEYINEDTFDQEIYIRRVADPMSVYLDPDVSEYDGSDARFGFVVADMGRDEYEEKYGDFDAIDSSSSPLGDGSSDGWEDEDHIRVCEYYRKTYKTDRLHLLDNGMTVRESDAKLLEKAISDRKKDEETHLDTLKKMSVDSREISNPEIEWFLIAGSKIIDRKKWAGKYIPLVRCVGRETVIDKTLDRKGHTRALIDPQRIYNTWTSSAVEQVALIGKTPYIGPSEAIQGYEEIWASANIKNKPILPYNQYTEDGDKLDAPQRVVPPQMAPAYLDGLKIAQQEMMMVSGQYEANMGQKSNEVSGTAVQERQRQGDNATYHFIAHFSQAIRYTGRILVDLIPKIYDTEREMNILNPDGSQAKIKIDPSQTQPHQQFQNPDDDSYNPQQIVAAMNPNMGLYGVECDIGPAYASRRQETFNALSQLMQQNKELTQSAGDLLFKAADFPDADVIAKRLKNLVPPQALGQGPTPEVQQLQQQLAKQHDVMSKLSQQLQQSQAQASKHDPGLDWYQAETARLAAVGKIDPAALMPIVRELVSQVLGTPVNPVIAAHVAQNEQMPGSDTQLANQQHAQNMQQQQADQAHQQNMQQAQQEAAAQQQAQAQQAVAQATPDNSGTNQNQ